MLTNTQECPCGSGLIIKYCCIPEDAPVSLRDNAFNNIEAQTTIETPYGKFTSPDINVSMDMRNPNQIFHIIDVMIGEAVNRMASTSHSEAVLIKSFEHINLVYDLLHSIRYNMRQFLYRLKMLHTQQLFNHPVKGNITITLLDLPLRSEIEAFISKARSLLDVTAKLVSCVIEIKGLKHGDLLKHLKASTSNGIKKELSELYGRNNEWITILKPLRENIQHDGTFSEFKSFAHNKGFFNQPRINNLTAEHYCFDLWKNQIKFLTDLFHVLFPINENKLGVNNDSI